MANYYTLLVRWTRGDFWTPEFGDFSRPVVEDEQKDVYRGDCYDSVIIKTDESQAAIAEAIALRNLPQIDSAINAAMAAEDGEVIHDAINAAKLAAVDSQNRKLEIAAAREFHGVRIAARKLANSPWPQKRNPAAELERMRGLLFTALALETKHNCDQ